MVTKFQSPIFISKNVRNLRFISFSVNRNIIHQAKKPRIEVGEVSCTKMVLDKVWENSVNFPGRYAFIDATNPQIKRTYRDVYLNSYSLATYLKNEMNFKKGQVACSFMPNSVDSASVFLGTTLAGGVISPASALFSADDLARQLNDSNSTLVYCTEAGLDTVLEAKKQAPRVTDVVTVGPLVSEFTAKKSIIYKDIKKVQPKFEDVAINSDEDYFCLPYSSGTTGLPKGVMLTHRNMATMLPNFTEMVKEHIQEMLVPHYIPTQENNILILPFFHIFGLGMMLKGIYTGESIVILGKFDLELFCKSIEQYRIRMITVAPPVLVALAKHPIIEKYDLSSLEAVLSGAAPVGRDLCNEVKKRIPSVKHIVQGFGMTEVAMVANVGSIKTNTPIESVGLLVNGYELKVVDPETGEALGINKKGELWYRSHQIMKGYLNRPEETSSTMDSEGWLHSGDIGFIDEDGHVYIVDRLKELIKVKGYQVPPAELEDLLLSHPKVKDCAVVGVPCEIRGEVPKAFVVKKCDTLKEDEIHDFVNEKVTKYKQLKGGVSFIPEIPKSPSGKILRRMLK